MRYADYNTSEKKRKHINWCWSKKSLFELVENYLDPTAFWTSDEDKELYYKMKECKTKKELLDKYADEIWEMVWNEYCSA